MCCFDLIIAVLVMKITYVTSSQEHICESVRITKFLTVASQAIWRQETPFSFLPYGKGAKGVIFVFLRIWCFQKSKESGKDGVFRSKVTIDYYFSFLVFPYACISHFSCVQLFVTLWTVAGQLLCPWDSLGKNTGVVAISGSRGCSLPRDPTHLSSVSSVDRQVL